MMNSRVGSEQCFRTPMIMASSRVLPSMVTDYVQNGSATPSKESPHYATSRSRLSELQVDGIISNSGALQPPDDPQPQDVDEFKLPNLSSLFIIIGGNALAQFSFFIVISSASVYAEYLGGSATFSGLTIGVPVIFSGIALIFTTRHDGGRYTQPLNISYAAMVLGNVLYALAYSASFLYLILIGRIVTGFGFISFMYSKRYCSDPRIVGIRRRTTLASWLVIGQCFGFSVGPFVGGVLYKIGFANKVFNGMTSPGWVMSVTWILFWILSSQIFTDVPIQPREESYELSQTNQTTENESQSPTVERQQVTPQQWGVIICMCYYAMTCFFILGSWEANIPVFTAHALGYSPFRAGNFIALGGIAAFPFLILNVRFARHLQDRVVLASGSSLGLIGLLIMLAILCTDKVHFGSLLVCWFLIALGFNMASTCTLSLLSKQLPDTWNGRISMAIQYSNYVGRVTGAVLGGAGVKMGMINYVGVQIVVVGIGVFENISIKRGDGQVFCTDNCKGRTCKQQLMLFWEVLVQDRGDQLCRNANRSRIQLKATQCQNWATAREIIEVIPIGFITVFEGIRKMISNGNNLKEATAKNKQGIPDV